MTIPRSRWSSQLVLADVPDELDLVTTTTIPVSGLSASCPLSTSAVDPQSVAVVYAVASVATSDGRSGTPVSGSRPPAALLAVAMPKSSAHEQVLL